MASGSPEIANDNAEKTLAIAKALFPHEEWILKEPGIWVGKSRVKNMPKERAKLAWEIEQIRVFISLESTVYFLPELEMSISYGKFSADTVIDGEIVEIKAVTGTRATLGTEFRKGYKQGAYLCERLSQLKAHSVFIRLFSNLSIGSVKAKIAGELKNRKDEGRFISYFEALGELHSWTYGELIGMIKDNAVKR